VTAFLRLTLERCVEKRGRDGYGRERGLCCDWGACAALTRRLPPKPGWIFVLAATVKSAGLPIDERSDKTYTIAA